MKSYKFLVPVSAAAALAKNGAEGEQKMDNLVETSSTDQGREHTLLLNSPGSGIVYGHKSHSSHSSHSSHRSSS
jgi:hypothetical protein